MIKIHKIEDDDIVKMSPMIDKNDNISWIKEYDCAFIGGLMISNGYW